MAQLTNINVASHDLMPTPRQIHERLPISEAAAGTVTSGRNLLQSILDGEDSRRFIVVGPCSIHDMEAARDYAQRLQALAENVREQFMIIMRVYFEKPRTTTGWKGFINDPRIDDSFHIEEGISLARELLLELAEMGLPTGTEALDPIMPQYLSDLVTWTAIGARTTESQTHREMSSGLSTPVGFKNGTDGNVEIAINAIKSSASPHSFLGINMDGQSVVVRTRGNNYGHLVLRGGGGKPNYDSVCVALAQEALRKAGLRESIVVDCSHANSNKDPELQPLVMENCVNQILEGNQSICGLMIESHLEAGNQSIPADLSQLRYGVSITDACVDWPTTEAMIRGAAERLAAAG